MDIATIRSQTPGCSKRVHFNNAGSSLMPHSVVQTLHQHVDREAEFGGYEAEDMVREQLDDFHVAAAELVGASDPSEIAFCSNASRGWLSLFCAMRLGPQDTVVTCRGEYSSNYVALRRSGCQVRLVEATAEAVEAAIDSSVKLIAVTHVPAECGRIAPAAAIGAVAQRHGIPYILDTTQSIGQMPIDVKALGCSALCATGRKYLRGPRGSGFIWVSSEWSDQLNPIGLDLYSAQRTGVDSYAPKPGARRFETWEVGFAGKLALGRAIRYALSLGLDDIWGRIRELSGYARSRLAEVKGLELADQGEQESGIITLRMKHHSADELETLVTAYGIQVSIMREGVSYYPECGSTQGDVVRISLHCFNTTKEIDRLIKAVSDPS